MFLYRYLTYDDLVTTINAAPTSHDINEVWPLYKSLKGKDGKLIIDRLNDQIEIEDERKSWYYFCISISLIRIDNYKLIMGDASI